MHHQKLFRFSLYHHRKIHVCISGPHTTMDETGGWNKFFVQRACLVYRTSVPLKSKLTLFMEFSGGGSLQGSSFVSRIYDAPYETFYFKKLPANIFYSLVEVNENHCLQIAKYSWLKCTSYSASWCCSRTQKTWFDSVRVRSGVFVSDNSPFGVRKKKS